MYKCVHFDIKELVSPEAYRLKGERCWRWFPEDVLRGLDMLWEEFGGGVYINTWGFNNPKVIGQVYSFSGYHMKGEYKRSEFSGHRMWCSFDIKFTKHTSKEVRIKLLGFEPTSNQFLPKIERHPFITELEYGISWFHVRFISNVKGVLVYKP